MIIRDIALVLCIEIYKYVESLKIKRDEKLNICLAKNCKKVNKNVGRRFLGE